MTETAHRAPVVDFDHNSDEHSADPAGSYRALREEHPVAWSDAHGGYWVLSGYDAVFEAARDDYTFSSARNSYGGEGLSVVIPKTPAPFHIPIEIDPPDFKKWRKLINPITAPAAVERMEKIVQHFVTAFIDDIIEVGEADLTSVIGVPAIVTVDWLGLPIEHWKTYAFAFHALLVAVPGTPEFDKAVNVDLPMLEKVTKGVIAERMADPKDDIISYLAGQEVDGRPITADEVFAIVDLLLSGGVGTTASLVSNTVVWLYKNQDVRADLIENPDKLERAIEEFLRFFSPTQGLARTVTKDVEFQGVDMHEGDRVLIAWSSANRDAGHFEDADEVDIERWPNRHTAFGIGAHRCAGSHLGRAMAKELLSQILGRMGDYVVDLDALEPYPHQGTNTGWQAIPATFTPGPRVLEGDPLAATEK
ncbi:cytochrome P450 [Nocardioides alkalitolerans]|uniref:cytochrome P450 n=1 Tax=Nocardioides alkalitolerans TaxID=281714 RepID=UPI00041078FC|nr:cytochrome P450 [Nocardioides alkalitolerans]